MTETQRLMSINNITVDVQVTPKTCYINVKYPDPCPQHRGEYTTYSSQSEFQDIQSEIESMIGWLAHVGDIIS